MFYLKNKEGNCYKEVENVSQKRALEAVGFVEYQPKAAKAPATDEATTANEAAKADEAKAPATDEATTANEAAKADEAKAPTKKAAAKK